MRSTSALAGMPPRARFCPRIDSYLRVSSFCRSSLLDLLFITGFLAVALFLADFLEVVRFFARFFVAVTFLPLAFLDFVAFFLVFFLIAIRAV